MLLVLKPKASDKNSEKQSNKRLLMGNLKI